MTLRTSSSSSCDDPGNLHIHSIDEKGHIPTNVSILVRHQLGGGFLAVAGWWIAGGGGGRRQAALQGRNPMFSGIVHGMGVSFVSTVVSPSCRVASEKRPFCGIFGLPLGRRRAGNPTWGPG
jgi:hypothetical protein